MDPKLEAKIAAVTAKRARTVLDHLLKHGRITTAELKNDYGYNHPPRAIGDVRDHGIPIRVKREAGPDGRSMAVYVIDETAAVDAAKHGRRAFSKSFKEMLVLRDGERCALCGGHFAARALQIDHRVPYEIGGDADEEDEAGFMLVCGSCNRAKSWSCEHCPNRTTKKVETCQSCLWASPTAYTHVATEAKRRLDVVWEGDEVADYDRLAAAGDVREAVKRIVKRALGGYPKS
jgi:hypothetical protein